MDKFTPHLISLIPMLAGLVGVYVAIVARLARIETRLDMDEKGKEDRRKIRAAEVHTIVRRELIQHRIDCPAVEVTGVQTPAVRSDSEP